MDVKQQVEQIKSALETRFEAVKSSVEALIADFQSSLGRQAQPPSAPVVPPQPTQPTQPNIQNPASAWQPVTPHDPSAGSAYAAPEKQTGVPSISTPAPALPTGISSAGDGEKTTQDPAVSGGSGKPSGSGAVSGVVDETQPKSSEYIQEGITSTTKTNGKADVGGGGPNTINLENTTDEPMEVAFFKNFAPYEPNHIYAEGVFTLQPGEKLEVSMPDEWQGRVQKWSGSTQDYSNWAEINFESSTDLIWFNESDIPGRNSSMRITSGDGEVAGLLESVLDMAPQNMLVKDSSGATVLKAPEFFTGEYNQESVDFLNEHVGTDNTYVLPPDHDAVRRSQSDTLTIEFGKA